MKNQKNSSLLYLVGIVFFILFFGLIFGLLAYYTLISVLEIQQDVLEFLKALIYNEEESFGAAAKFTLFLKTLNIVLYFLLALFSFSLFSSGLSGLFYTFSAKREGYEEVSQAQAFRKIIEWQLYKYFVIFLPLMGFVFATGIFILAGVVFFNYIVTGIGVSAAISFFILSFAGFNLMFFLSLAVLAALRKAINTIFGTEIAVSEPELDNRSIALRSKRIFPAAGSNFLLLFVFAIFALLLALQVKNLNIIDAQVFTAFILFNSVGYAGLKYLKTNAYIKSLLNYYEMAKLTAN